MLKLIFYLVVPLLFLSNKAYLPDSKRAGDIRTAVWPRLKKELGDKGLKFNYPIYMRIFKEEKQLEIWIKSGKRYQLFKCYNICFYSGGLGTKTRAGDRKSPEGFYTIKPNQLNPESRYHLAINIGYPNKLETANGYTGNNIMIHGICSSDGCYAMTDQRIEEIYTLVYKAFESGQKEIMLDIFPFRMDELHLKTYGKYSCLPFWKTIKPAYDLFQKNHIPPVVKIKGREYVF